MATNPLLKGLQPMHPGEMLREDVLPSLGKSKTEIASLLGISRQTLFDILRKCSRSPRRWPCASASCSETGRTSGSICSGPTIFASPISNLGRFSAKIPTITAA